MYDRDDVLKDLRNWVVEFTMDKGIMFRATLKPEYLPKQYKEEKNIEEEYHNNNPEMITCFGVVQKKYFTFNIKDVKYMQLIDSY